MYVCTYGPIGWSRGSAILHKSRGTPFMLCSMYGACTARVTSQGHAGGRERHVSPFLLSYFYSPIPNLGRSIGGPIFLLEGDWRTCLLSFLGPEFQLFKLLPMISSLSVAFLDPQPAHRRTGWLVSSPALGSTPDLE